MSTMSSSPSARKFAGAMRLWQRQSRGYLPKGDKHRDRSPANAPVAWQRSAARVRRWRAAPSSRSRRS